MGFECPPVALFSFFQYFCNHVILIRRQAEALTGDRTLANYMRRVWVRKRAGAAAGVDHSKGANDGKNMNDSSSINQC